MKERSPALALVLVLILLLAAILRLYRFDMADVITDEVLYGYRSIGLVDSLNSPFQPTPFEWYQDIPWWAKVSFRDHPPLIFWIQHNFFKIFGVNLLGMRLPFIIAGLISVYLVYAISRKLFRSERVGLLAAAILAVSNYHVWISRIGLQESMVIVFILFAILLFLKTLESPRYFYWTVAVTAFALLTKYTAVFLIPLFAGFLFWKRRDLLTARRIFFSALLFLVILSPVIVYNLKLYQARGHFDFQLSFLLDQDVEEWRERPGREVGGLGTKFQNLFVRFFQNSGAVFSILSALAILHLFKRSKEPQFQFVAASIVLLLLLFLAVGPQERFLSMLSPFLAIWIAAFFSDVFFPRKIGRVFFALFLILELAFTVNTNHFIRSKGQEGLGYSLLRRESEIYGYNQLEKYLADFTKGYYSVTTFPSRFSFVAEEQKKWKEKAKSQGREPVLALFVTDSNIHGPSRLWYFTRRLVYEGWPFMDDSAYLARISSDPDFFKKQGFKQIVFIVAWNTLFKPDSTSVYREELEKIFKPENLQPVSIVDRKGKFAFGIYNLDLTLQR